MRTNSITFRLMILGLSVLGACADKVDSTPTPDPTVTPSDRGNDDTPSTTNNRLCLGTESKVTLNGSSASAMKSALSGYFAGRVVSNVEGDVTYCLDVYGTGENVTADLRVEYEDDYGITSFDAKESMNQYGWSSLKLDDDTGKWDLNVVWMDGYGLVQLKASSISSADEQQMSGTIRYYTFPSFQTQLNNAVADLKAKCKSGEYTVARCLGYASPYPSIKWWEQPDASTPKTEALNLLSNSGRNLGTIRFTLGNVVSQ